MKKKLSLLLAFVICLSLVPCAYADNSPFTDIVPDFWAYDAIREAYNDGVMTGTATRTFSPDGKLDMAQFTTILARAFYKNEMGTAGPGEDWWDPAYKIAYASNHNLFGEVHNIASNTETTREVMAEMMYRVMVDKGAILPNDAEIQMTMSKIPDLASVDNSFRTAVAVCYYLDLLAGVDARGTFAPKGVLNRAQTAVIYTRLKNALNLLSIGGSNPGTTNPGTTTNPGVTPNPGTTTDPGTTQTPSGATLTNGMPVTEENVLALIEEYRNGKEPGQKAKDAGFTSYAPKSTYDAYNPAYSIRQLGFGTACAKFAFAFSDDIFGADALIREFSNPADVRPGDLIHFNGHWCLATNSAQYFVEDNFYAAPSADGGTTGRISWGNGSNINDALAFYTRYPE